MRTIYAAFIVCFVLLSNSFSAVTIDTLDPIPCTKNTIYEIKFPDTCFGLIRFDDGVIYQTLDSSLSWDKLPFKASITMDTTNLPSIYTAVSNVISFLNQKVGCIGCPDGTIQKTINGGVSWVSLSTGYTKPITSISILDSNRVMAVAEDGNILRTSDGGGTWKSVVKTSFPVIYFKNDSVGLVTSGSKLYRSQDTGRTWEPISFSSSIKSFYFINDSTCFAFGVNSNDRWVSTNLGKTWSAAAYIGRKYIDVNNGWPLEDGTVHWFINGYQSGDLQYFISDSNSYTTVTPAPPGMGKPEYPQVYKTKLNIYHNQQLVFPLRWVGSNGDNLSLSFRDSLHGLCMLDRNFYQTSDGGKTWEFKDFKGKILLDTIFSFGYIDDSTMYALSKTTLYRLSLLSIDVTVLSSITVSADTVFHLFKPIGNKCAILLKKCLQPSNMVSYKEFRTDDLGITWTEVPNNLCGHIYDWKNFHGDQFCLIDTILYRSKDTGKTFVPFQPPSSLSINSFSIINDSVYVLFHQRYIGSDKYNITIYKTNDTGRTWSTDTNVRWGRCFDVKAHFLDAYRGFALFPCNNPSYLSYTNDGGKSFNQISPRIDTIVPINANTVIAVANLVQPTYSDKGTVFGCYRITADSVTVNVEKINLYKFSYKEYGFKLKYEANKTVIKITNINREKGTLTGFTLNGQMLFRKEISSALNQTITLSPDCTSKIIIYQFVTHAAGRMITGQLVNVN